MLWALVSLVILDLSLDFFNPLKQIHNFNYMPLSRNPILSKIPEFLKSSIEPDVLVMGSSLPMMTIAMWDAEYAKSLDTSKLENIRVYTGAIYLEELLQKKYGTKFQVYNLTSVGAMASDAALVLEKSLKCGKHPKAIIYGIGPRTFQDNTYPEFTPIAEVLTKWRTFDDLRNSELSFDEKRDVFFSQVWNYYREKSDYKSFFVNYACHKLNRAPTLYAAQQRIAARDALQKKDSNIEPTANESVSAESPDLCVGTADYKPQSGQLEIQKPISPHVHPEPEKLKADLALYNVRYNPPNLKRFSKELAHLDDFISLCQKEKIKLLIVNMPITSQNKSLLKDDLYELYLKEISKLASKSTIASLIDLNDGKTCTLSDFTDSVHCNAVGGKKVQDRLVGTLDKSNWM